MDSARLALLAARPDETGELARELQRLQALNATLRAAIETHRSATGHALCWLNDVALWQALGDGQAPPAPYPHETLPVREEFLAQCARFHASRLLGTPYEEPLPQQTVSGPRAPR